MKEGFVSGKIKTAQKMMRKAVVEMTAMETIFTGIGSLYPRVMKASGLRSAHLRSSSAF